MVPRLPCVAKKELQEDVFDGRCVCQGEPRPVRELNENVQNLHQDDPK